MEIGNLNEENLQKNKKIENLEKQIEELKAKYRKIIIKNKRILKLGEQLKENEFNINFLSDKEKLEKLNILVNIYKEASNKINIEKSKLEEINKINNEIGNINFFDSKFFNNFKNKNPP